MQYVWDPVKDAANRRKHWIPLGTLRDWQQRRKKADRAAQAYLKVIEGEPAVVAELLTK